MTIRNATGSPGDAIGAIDNYIYKKYNTTTANNENSYACVHIQKQEQRVRFAPTNGQGEFAVQGNSILFKGEFGGVKFNELVNPEALDTADEIQKILKDHGVDENPQLPSKESVDSEK